jgi:hypothetical protein
MRTLACTRLASLVVGLGVASGAKLKASAASATANPTEPVTAYAYCEKA